MVRYLLNRPGFLKNSPGVETYGESDFIVHFADAFRPDGLSSERLWIPLVDRTVYRGGASRRERRGFLVYSVRHRPDVATFPDWALPRLVLSREQPRTPQALAALYRESVALVTCERTAAIGEAIHCGCPVIIIPHPGFDHEPIVRRYHGFGMTVGWDRARLAATSRTVRLAKGLYRLRSLGLDHAIHRFVRQTCRHFAAHAPP